MLAKEFSRVIRCQYFNQKQSPRIALLPDKYLTGHKQKQLLQDLQERVC